MSIISLPARAARRRPKAALAAAVALVALGLPAAAGAHARVSPAVSLSGKLQLYSLAVPTEKDGLTTSKVVMTVPNGFGIDSFVPPPPGWTQHVQQTGTGDSAVVTKVTWTGGKTPTGQDSLFQFLAQPASAEDLHLPGASRPTPTAPSSTGPVQRTLRHRRRRSKRSPRLAAAGCRP